MQQPANLQSKKAEEASLLEKLLNALRQPSLGKRRRPQQGRFAQQEEVELHSINHRRFRMIIRKVRT